MSARDARFRPAIVFCALLASTGCSGSSPVLAGPPVRSSSPSPSPSAQPTPAPTATPGFAVSLGIARPLLTESQRSALGFENGPPDGTVGAVYSPTGDMFFVSAHGAASCSTPNVTGTYRLGGTPTAFTGSYVCAALVATGAADPNGYTFDRDYAGGGPALAVTDGTRTGILNVYHGEFHQGTCKNGHVCFYSSLGLAFSSDGGASFSKLGEIVQPTIARAALLAESRDLDVGGGTLLLADANGTFVSTVTAANLASTYVYVFYTDLDESITTAPCSTQPCIAVARAPLSNVLNASFSNETAAIPTLFQKFYGGSFSQPATSGDPNAAVESGHYTPVVPSVEIFPSVIWDDATSQYVMASCSQLTTIYLRHSSSLLTWSSTIASAVISNAPNGLVYPTLLGQTANASEANGSAYLIYAQDMGVPWPNWADATVMENSLTFSSH